VSGWWLPLVAFAAMFAQDLVATVMVQAEAGYRPHLAASVDVVNDACGLASLAAIGGGIAVGSVILTAVTVAARLAADYAGTYTGVRVGQRLMARKATS
jgi:hypothetical protein